MPSNKKLTIGIDEAGRGCFAGPVVSAAVAFDRYNLPSNSILKDITDSKKLNANQRSEIFKLLMNESKNINPKLWIGVGIADNYAIDDLNIRRASLLAMQRALNELFRKIDPKTIHSLLVDGRDKYRFEGCAVKPIFIIEGDTKVKEISSASIIAKVFRDKLMSAYSLIYPEYGFENHKGYGTRQHRSVLSHKSKITSIHRVTFKPVNEVLLKKPRLLLHVCCGPDACIPIADLKKSYKIIGFWYDPNIQPKEEYEKRKSAFAKVCEIEGIEWIEGEYDIQQFFKTIQGFEMTPERGAKCALCYDMRLTQSVFKAKELYCEFFTTTLIMSPKKDYEKLTKIGKSLEHQFGIHYLDIPFRKNNGFNRSVQYTKSHNIYRQTYCGCVFSDTYPGKSVKKNAYKVNQKARVG